MVIIFLYIFLLLYCDEPPFDQFIWSQGRTARAWAATLTCKCTRHRRIPGLVPSAESLGISAKSREAAEAAWFLLGVSWGRD